MKLNYKKLGDYIQLVDERNKDLQISNLLGVSIQKKFIPSVANVSETDMSVYRVVRKNQFAFSPVTSRNGDKFTIALLKEVDSAIISPAYQVFEVIDGNLLLPEYLFIFLNRAEFDRFTRFNSWGSARETFAWDDVCDIEIPIPDIEFQKKVVAVYNELLRNQKSYEGSLSDLQLICDTYIENLAKKKNLMRLGDCIQQSDVRGENLDVSFLRGISTNKVFIRSVANTTDLNFATYKLVKRGQFAYVSDTSRRGDKIGIAMCVENKCIISSIYTVFEVVNDKKLLPEFLLLWFRREDFDRYARFHSWGSARETFGWEDMCEVRLPVPDIEVQKSIVAIHHVLESRKKLNDDLKNMITPLCPVLLKGVVDSLVLK